MSEVWAFSDVLIEWPFPGDVSTQGVDPGGPRGQIISIFKYVAKFRSKCVKKPKKNMTPLLTLITPDSMSNYITVANKTRVH